MRFLLAALPPSSQPASAALLSIGCMHVTISELLLLDSVTVAMAKLRGCYPHNPEIMAFRFVDLMFTKAEHPSCRTEDVSWCTVAD